MAIKDAEGSRARLIIDADGVWMISKTGEETLMYVNESDLYQIIKDVKTALLHRYKIQVNEQIMSMKVE